MKNYIIVVGIGLGVILVGMGLHANIIKLPFERVVEVSVPEGLATDRGFVGMSHNIFIGKVIRNIGQVDTGAIPETRFEIQIVTNIKGSLPEKVVMNQEGGYENGVLVRLEDSGSLLKEGSTYLLASRTDGNGRYVVFFYPRGTIVLSNNKTLTIEALKTLAATNKDVMALQEAYKTELLSAADVDHHAAFNNYQKIETVPATPLPPQTWN